MSTGANPFNHVNPYALASISEASETFTFLSSEDILDDRGIKLWARNQPVSPSLHERLLARKLRRPLESCLLAEDGITTVRLYESLQELLAGQHPIARIAAPQAERLLTEVKSLPLHAVVQLLLTAGHAARPTIYEHAIRGMALAGTLQLSAGGDRLAVRQAMLGGLLHDLGEMYVNPAYLDNVQKPLTLGGYRHVVTHPRVSELLLSRLTDYPAALALAVGQHHERLDGSGYPSRRNVEQITPLGRLLGVVELTLGVTAATVAPVMRAGLSLRMIPGEFDPSWTRYISEAATRLAEPLVGTEPPHSREELLRELDEINNSLTQGPAVAQALLGTHPSTDVKDVASHAAQLLGRLRQGWNAMGLWAGIDESTHPNAEFEIHAVKGELQFRLRTMQRDCLWRHPQMTLEEADALLPLWQSLSARR
jgi:hypothetical protein